MTLVTSYFADLRYMYFSLESSTLLQFRGKYCTFYYLHAAVVAHFYVILHIHSCKYMYYLL